MGGARLIAGNRRALELLPDPQVGTFVRRILLQLPFERRHGDRRGSDQLVLPGLDRRSGLDRRARALLPLLVMIGASRAIVLNDFLEVIDFVVDLA